MEPSGLNAASGLKIGVCNQKDSYLLFLIQVLDLVFDYRLRGLV